LRQNRLYNDLAYLWPVVSPPEEYALEAWHLREALRERLGPGRHTLLELGVGGGHVLSHLASEFQATAVDASEQMLALSRQLNPNVEHHLGDMRSVRLGRAFKVVLIHDAIAYMLTEADLKAAFATVRAHLEPGGVFIVAPDFFRETFKGTSVHHWITREDARREVTFIEYVHDPDPADTTIESIFFFLIQEDGQLHIEQDRHITGLFPLDTWLSLMGDAAFEVAEIKHTTYEGGYGGNILVGALTQGQSKDSPLLT
jgi:SAM-dependent methyltransferase